MHTSQTKSIVSQLHMWIQVLCHPSRQPSPVCLFPELKGTFQPDRCLRVPATSRDMTVRWSIHGSFLRSPFRRVVSIESIFFDRRLGDCELVGVADSSSMIIFRQFPLALPSQYAACQQPSSVSSWLSDIRSGSCALHDTACSC